MESEFKCKLIYDFIFFKGGLIKTELISSILTLSWSNIYSSGENGIIDGGVNWISNSTVDPPRFPAKGIKE